MTPLFSFLISIFSILVLLYGFFFLPDIIVKWQERKGRGKFCRDCVHCVVNNYKYSCSKYNTEQSNMVTGEITCTNGDCYTLRGYSGKCGKQAKGYQAK